MKVAGLPDDGLAGSDKGASLQERAYRLLKAMIGDGRIGPGERLLEAQVAKAFGISRSPARHALRTLCAEALLEEHDGKGFVVAGCGTGGGDGLLASLEPVRIQSPPQWERIYKEVEQELFIRILFGAVRINEKQLALHFDVSRTVTRDLLARMHGMGLIEKDDAGHWLSRRITPEHIRDLYEMRRLLEPKALQKSLPHLPAPVLHQARDRVLLALKSDTPDSAAFDRIERDLHVDVLSGCQNKEILRALERTQLVFGPTRYLFHPFLGVPVEMIDGALKEHLEILDRALRGDADGAAQALQDHLKVADDRWLRRFEIIASTTRLQFPAYLSPAGG
ncbi:GntR family transcriptional regulator [Azospirillum picis]|uniref:DNA-binding GntR family transcriptional regulator n=1 Tax=Azospirillum picis TaxID=488438 RepID=A0ABU0MHU8_9PROT|nr:GntR family transcriptional regulator [Azospirillum picis]MBP2299327.1 DNA-binding GntR family transcriptional regulator [Azospirillum picis]MDQ0533035.1 DNA-binding GntR family transcriptional regulator [Azospirillum picis]